MPSHKAQPYDHEHEEEVTLFGLTNFRNQERRFGIKTDDRRRHTYVIGKTGMGKSTVLENMVVSDINAGHGLAYIDPHGDTAEKLLDFIPPHRINDVVYFNPADMDFPVGFNILEIADENQKHLVAAGLMGVFKKIWPDVWSSRMEYILLNTIMALLDFPGSTLLGINRLLSDEEYRARVVSLIQDPVVKTFWLKEFASFSEKYRTEAVAPLQNKVGQFLSATIIRNIVAQVKSTIDVREIMDTRKIFIVNLAKGRIGEENSRLLGAMIITRIQLAAMERVDMPERERQDFYLYVDEFQNFATESFANILSEARKYRLNLIVAHQYIEQLDELVRAAIFGNVGTILAFRVGAADAAFMENEFMPRFTPEDLVNLRKFEVYLKLMIDGASSEAFSAKTFPPIAQNMGTKEKVIKVSRERYGAPRKTIEEKVIKWAGYGTADTGQTLKSEDEVDEEERKLEEEIERRIATSPDVGEMAQPSDGGFGGKKKKKPLFQVPCAVCGKMQDLTFEPDWTKPWLCKEHLEAKKAGTLPRGLKLRPASDFKPGADGTNPAASMGASASASMPLSAPAAAPAAVPVAAPAQRPSVAPIARPIPASVPAPRSPAASAPAQVTPRPQPTAVAAPAPAPKPAPTAAAHVASAKPTTAPAPAVPPTQKPRTEDKKPQPPKEQRSPQQHAPRKDDRPPHVPRLPDPAAITFENGAPIPLSGGNKPRIVLSKAEDDEQDLILVPKKPVEGTLPAGAVAPAAVSSNAIPFPTSKKQEKPDEPEPLSTPKDDDGPASGTVSAGQVVKF